MKPAGLRATRDRATERAAMTVERRRYPVYTIGHSTRTIEEFVELLRAGEVGRVVDVRTIRRSRTNPQFNEDALPDSLSPWQIAYTAIPELGGRRSRQKTVTPDINGFWKNRSFHNYADYALSAEFHTGLERLMALGEDMPCAIMCSEAVWWRCHRRIVADYLLLEGWTVLHLMNVNRVEPAKPTPGAVAQDGVLVYP